MDDRKLIPWWPDAGRALGGLGRTKTYYLIKSGELPSVTIGRRRFVAMRDLEEFIERRRAAAQGGGEAA
jgi:excisionase family DNA binding protein